MKGSKARASHASPGSGRSARQASLPQLAVELKELVVTYLKQETIVPLRQLGRYVAFGLAGSVLLGTGSLLLAVGVLRLLQTETGTTFSGDWSWAPYLIVVAALMVGAGIVWRARRSFRLHKEASR